MGSFYLASLVYFYVHSHNNFDGYRNYVNFLLGLIKAYYFEEDVFVVGRLVGNLKTIHFKLF